VDTGLRVLLVGLDGGTWRVLDPLMAQGALPNLARLAQEGFAARIDSPPPQVSPALWATVVTGVAAESHGIRDYLVVRLPGVDEFAFDSLANDRTLIPFSFATVCLFLAGVAEGIPPSADRLAVPALWDYLDAGGDSALWLGWPGTWPARRVRGLVVSDRFGPNEWDMFSSRRRPPAGSVWPAAAAAPLRERARDSRGDIGAALAGIMSFEPAELESLRALVINPLLPEPARMLADVLDADLTLLDILSERFPAGGFALGAVMFNAADLALHAFWPERFPADFQRERAAHPSRGAIVDAVLGELDRRIGEVLARAGPDIVLVLLSDHGMKADPGNPVWPGWHDRDAMLLMAGGPVRSGLPRGEFDHRDVAPTVLYLLGFAVPESMSGRVRTDVLDPAFVARHPVRRLPDGP
jgi:predicted AlkP superfamily phosphohydrolase/phosphomutase